MPWSFLSQLGGAASGAVNTLGNMFGQQQQQQQAQPQPTPAAQYEYTPGVRTNELDDQGSQINRDVYGTSFSGQGSQQMAASVAPPTQMHQPQMPVNGQIPPIAPFVSPVQAQSLPPLRPNAVGNVFARRSALLG